MATILKTFGAGGVGLSGRGGRHANIATILRDVADDLVLLRNAHNALATKLNADAGVTDTNYAQAAALKTVKG